MGDRRVATRMLNKIMNCIYITRDVNILKCNKIARQMRSTNKRLFDTDAFPGWIPGSPTKFKRYVQSKNCS